MLEVPGAFQKQQRVTLEEEKRRSSAGPLRLPRRSNAAHVRAIHL